VGSVNGGNLRRSLSDPGVSLLPLPPLSLLAIAADGAERWRPAQGWSHNRSELVMIRPRPWEMMKNTLMTWTMSSTMIGNDKGEYIDFSSSSCYEPQHLIPRLKSGQQESLGSLVHQCIDNLLQTSG